MTWINIRCVACNTTTANRPEKVDASQLADGTLLVYFPCVTCRDVAIRCYTGLVSDSIAAVLSDGGVHITAAEPAASGPPLTIDDLIDFGVELQRRRLIAAVAEREIAAETGP